MRKRNLLDLIGTLPDFAHTFRRYGLPIAATTASIEKTTYIDANVADFKFRLHGAPGDMELRSILDGFSVHHHFADRVTCAEQGQSAIVTLHRQPMQDGVCFRFPEIRITLEGEWIMYTNDMQPPELADAYQAAFGLSMLARYYPDFWIACIESHCSAAKIVEHFVDVYLRKFPMLTLWYMYGPIITSTQAAPYHRD